MVPVVHDVMPTYPNWSKKRNIEGTVTLAYEIDKRGKAKNFRVIDAEPTRIFVRSAMIALKKSRFEVTRVDGRPVKVRDQQRSYVYSLDQSPYVAALESSAKY
jgi:protein TonB